MWTLYTGKTAYFIEMCVFCAKFLLRQNWVAVRLILQGGKSAEKNKNKIFMGGLPTNATEDQVREVFEQFGPVSHNCSGTNFRH